MKKILAFGWMALGFSFALLACGGDPCGDLEERCGGCTDAGQQVACQLAVGLDDSDSCQQLLDDATFQQACP